MGAWVVDRVVHFDFDADPLVKAGCVHFGFHDRAGRHYGIDHRRHYVALIDDTGRLAWTVAPRQVSPDIPNIAAGLEYPMYIDVLREGTVAISNFESAEVYSVDLARKAAKLLIDGHSLGMRDAGNCVVDEQGYIWVNEVRGCRVWRFDPSGRPVLTLGDVRPGFQRGTCGWDDARFSWIYDLRRGPDGQIHVLDSRNYALRVIDPAQRTVRTIAGTGRPGYAGDGGDAREATFGGDATARFDGPISLSVDDDGSLFVGDRYNQVVRMIDPSGTITTIAGRHGSLSDQPNDPTEVDPRRVSLPQISSLDCQAGRLFIPTDLTSDSGDLVVLRSA